MSNFNFFKKSIFVLLTLTALFGATVAVNAATEATYTERCKVCGEVMFTAPGTDNSPKSSFTFKKDYTSFTFDSSAVANPHQVEFTLTLVSVDVSKANNRNVMRYWESYNSSLIRQYNVKDKDGNNVADKLELKGFGTSSAHYATISKGESVKFTLWVEPANDTIDVYVNDKYVETRYDSQFALDTATGFRFGHGDKDSVAGTVYEVSDVTIITPTTRDIDKVELGSGVVTEFSITDKSITQRYECACGKEIFNSEISKSLMTCDSVYYGKGTIENVPTEGEFWFATDYNIRTAQALEEVKATDDDIVFGDLKIAIDRAVISAPETYQTALKVSYAENSDTADVQLWVDGKLEKVYTNITLGDSIALGSLDTTDVRFAYTKIVEAGDSETQIEYNDTLDASVIPCIHLANGYFKNVAVASDSSIVFDFECAKCGEIVYSAPVVDYHSEADSGLSYKNGAFSFSAGGSKWSYYFPKEIIGVDKDPYQLEMTVKLTAVGSDRNKLYNSGNGRNLLRFTASEFSFLRQYPVSDGNGGYLSDTIFIGSMIKFGVEPIPLTQIKVGESIKFEFYITPAEHKADIYVNGKYVATREGTDVMSSLSEVMQFGDGNAPGCNYTISDIHILRPADTHIHTDKWLTDEEKATTTLVVGEDNTISYEYDCYCGKRASKGIAEIIADSIAPQYGLTEKFVAVTAPQFEGEAVFVGRILAKELPAEGTKALVSVGETAVLSVDNAGLLYVNGTANETTLTVGEYLGFALVLSSDRYSVYFNGEYLGEGELEALGDIAVGSEGMGKFHFEAMALVTLSSDGDGKYSVVTDSHAHSFDPYTAELIFNAEKTTINVEFVCTVCDKPAISGITKDLYDNETTDETEVIPAVIGTSEGGAVIVNTVGEYTADEDTYWFSADFKVKEFSNKNRQPIVSLGANGILLIDADGTLRLADEANTVIGSAKKQGSLNVTFSVQKGEIALVHVYLDGKYCGTLELALDGTESIKAGADSMLSLEVTNIKLCQIGNGGVRHIGAFSCQYHIFDASKAVINYLDLDSFVVKNRCLVCGHMITERPAYNNYVGATMPIYDAHGNVELPLNEADFGAELDASYHGHWIVVDVNTQGSFYDIGNFYGFKNLIGSKGNSLVLIDPRGKLMLGNGKELDSKFQFNGKTTKNFALEYVYADADGNPETDDGYINVYIDGKYAINFAVADVKYKYEHISASYEEFGATELENIKFYNIRSFVTCAEGEFVTFEYAEDESVIPCAHVFDRNYMTKTAVFGEEIQIVYICDKCGERVHKVFDKNLYDTSLNSKFVFDENGELTISNTTDLVSSPDVIGTAGSKYWLKFKLDVKELNVDAVSANDNNNNKGRILLNFNTNNNSPLRLFGVYDYETKQYLDDCLIVKNNTTVNASQLVRIYEGGSYEFALYVDPAERMVEIYLNGNYVSTRYNATYASGVNIRFLDGNWGTFTISDFAFVTGDNIDHIHTAQYSEEFGMTPVVEYGDRTLVHKFICTCGKTIEAGIDEAFGYEIQNIENATSATPIAEAMNGKVNREPYFVSAKVYGDGSTAAVYSYNGTELVGIADGKYTVGGIATDIPVSHTITPGDYDLISLNVIPAEDTALVYINGFEAGRVNTDFADSEKFNILLGGGAELDFRFIKAVTLADGANNEIDIAACGDHEFAYRSGIIAEITADGVDYKCKYCDAVVKTVALGEGGIINADSLTLNGKAQDVAQDKDFYGTVMKPDSSGSIWISFKASSSNLANQKDDETFFKFQINNDHGIYIRLFKVDNDTVRYEFFGSSSASAPVGDALLEKGQEYTFVIVHDPISRQYHVYVDGIYKGGNSFKLDYGESATYKLYVGSSASWNISDFRVYNPTVEEDKEVVVKDEEITYPHNHFPDYSKKDSISVENGVIVQKFTCTCGEKVELDAMNSIVKNNKTDITRVSSDAKLDVFDETNYGKGTYVLSFDFKPQSINIPADVEDGTWLAFFYEPSTKRDLAILSVYRHAYKEGEGYADKNGDGFADGVFDLRSKTGINSGNPILATVKAGDSVNFTYVIDPTSRYMAVYVNGEYKHFREGFGKFTSDDVYLRLKASDYGQLVYDNVKLVRMSDECTHDAPCCATGVYGVECTLCHKTVVPTHNYKKEYDRRNMWIKYTCESCGAFHIEFNSLSRLKDVAFINENELINYLSENYCPVFK